VNDLNRRDLLILGAGTAIAWPLAARAQQKVIPVIGYLHFGSPGPFAYQLVAFRQGLAQNGYVEGQNVAIETRWAEGHNDRLPGLAADLVTRNVKVIYAGGPPAAVAAKNATATIPIVFSVGIDPVAAGLVASLARPGGNLTGFSIIASDLTPKRLELLSELVPQAKLFGLLVNPDEANPGTRELEEAVRAKGLQLAIVKASSESEIDAAFATLANLHADALVIGDAVFFTFRREQLVALASHYRLPTIERWREFSVAGGLVSYGPSLVDLNRQVGIYVGRILQGEKPADLAVQQPTKFELVINLKTAKALGLTVPQSILARADEVIE
jgi:putative tryptophan/tyrosine transport system substrate-binding protein